MKWLLFLLVFAAQAAPPPVAWSLTDHSEFIAIGAQATRTNIPFGGGFVSARSDTTQSVGVRNVEVTINQLGPTGVVVGVVNGAASTNNFVGVDNNGVGYRHNGNIMRGSAWVGVAPLPPAFTTGDVIGMSVDLDAHNVKFRKNGGAWSVPVDISSLGSYVSVAVSLGGGAPAASIQLNGGDNWNDYPWTTLNIVAVGDSITNNGGVLQTYVPRLVNLIAGHRVGWAQGYHFGINGATWQYAWSAAGYPYSINQDIPIRAIPALSASLPNWVILFAGTNGEAIFHDTAANQYAGLKAAFAIVRAAGVPADHIIVNTMLPRGNEAFRSAYNALIVADPSSLGYRVARLDLDPNIGCVGCNMSAFFLPDHIHPADAGQQIIAQVNFAVMYP